MSKLQEGKKLLREFEDMTYVAELNALSKYSLEHPLTDQQYLRMMALKGLVFG